MQSSARDTAAPTIALLVWLLCALGCGAPEAVDEQPVVIFVVLDTVRADHLSACGYDRPTSAQLERLVEQTGAFFSCGTYAPGDWTLPSHASFFTGVDASRHGARIATDGPVLADITVSPLPDSFPTLAEQFSQRGYQTMAISANPVLDQASGLMRGFATWHAARYFGELRAKALINVVQEHLAAEIEPDGGPLFLFVNIADAHGPWLPVPETLGWIPPQPEVRIDIDKPGSVYRNLVRGELTEEEFLAAVETYRNAYDFGVYRADRTLGMLIRSLRADGWLDRHHRIIVTSDHGEYLGERGLVGHGGSLLEANNRIPLLYLDSNGSAFDLPDPLSGLAAYHLVRDGELRSVPQPLAVAFPNIHILRVLGDDIAGYAGTSVGLWEGDRKLLWRDGILEQYDLIADPRELSPQQLDPQLTPPAMEAILRELAALAAQPTETNPELLEKLRALGYVD